MTAIKVNELTEKRIVEALTKQIPMRPRRFELGGGYYYRCYWASCDNTVTRWQNHCDQCGQRLLWDDE